jgi:hypothetical protein
MGRLFSDGLLSKPVRFYVIAMAARCFKPKATFAAPGVRI